MINEVSTKKIFLFGKITILKIYNEGELTGNQNWLNEEDNVEIIHIIAGDLNIRENANLVIEDKTKVLLKNGNNNYGQLNFNAGSKLEAKKIISYGIDFDINNIYSSTFSRSSIANNGGWVFNGNDINSYFVISNFEGESLGNLKNFGALNIKDMKVNFLKIDEIKLINCNTNLFLYNSQIKIKKCIILKNDQQNVTSIINSFNFERSTLNISSLLWIICDNLFYPKMNGYLIINKGSIIYINVKKACVSILFESTIPRFKSRSYKAIDSININTEGKKIEDQLTFENANKPPVNNKPISIDTIN